MAKYSEKQNKWTQDYIKKAYDEIKVRVPKGQREVYKAYADSLGKSMNQLIGELLDQSMGRTSLDDLGLEGTLVDGHVMYKAEDVMRALNIKAD